MGMVPENQAAWLASKKERPLKVGPAPYTPPGAGEVVVKNSAVAINPIDWQKQVLGDVLLGYIKYPFILGGDVAGTVIEVGEGVRRFQVGDRVVGAALAIAESCNKPAQGAYQLYTVVPEHMAAPLPDHVSEEAACVVPLTLCTAAYGLFHDDFLALDPPKVPARPTAAGTDGKSRAVIITGGSTSVGANAIQLAVAAGYEVSSTASPKNHAMVKRLGASRVFDYRSKTLVADLRAAVKGRTLAGAMAIGDGAVDVCTEVLKDHPERTNKFIALAGGSSPGEKLASFWGMTALVLTLLWSVLKGIVLKRLTGVNVKFIDLQHACDTDGVVANVWTKFLPKALVEGQFVPSPKFLKAGKGLDKVQDAMDMQMKGVSAQKIIVTL